MLAVSRQHTRTVVSISGFSGTHSCIGLSRCLTPGGADQSSRSADYKLYSVCRNPGESRQEVYRNVVMLQLYRASVPGRLVSIFPYTGI